MGIPSALAILALLAASVSQQASAEKQGSSRDSSLLTMEAVEIDPAHPGPETLCKVRVRLRNKGKQAASDFGFQVTINGQQLSVYSNQVWATRLAPGKDTDLQLYNFWTSEPGRPKPKDSRPVGEVRLRAARWYDADGKPSSDVDPLPPPRSITLTMGATKGS
jgi:hypothetical protein